MRPHVPKQTWRRTPTPDAATAKGTRAHGTVSQTGAGLHSTAVTVTLRRFARCGVVVYARAKEA